MPVDRDIPKKYAKLPLISLVYTFYNQLDYLKYNLIIHAELARNALFPFELIICDDGSSDGTEKFMKEELEKFFFPVKYLRQEHKGFRVGEVKNMGIRAAEGEYIYIADGDTFPTFSTYIHLLDHISPNHALMGKRVKLDWNELKKNILLSSPFQPADLEAAAMSKEDWRGQLGDIPPKPYTHFSGANVMFPAADLKKIEWTPKDWEGYGFDDYVCTLKWLGIIGKPIKAVNESVAYHVHHDNTEGHEPNRIKMKELEAELKPKIQAQFQGWWEEGSY